MGRNSMEFVSKRAVPIPGTNVELNRTGQFFAGVAVGVGVFITVRVGTRVLSKIFSRAAYRFLKSWLTREFIQNVTAGPIPGTLLGPNPSFRKTFFAFTNVGMWITGIWSAVFEASMEAGREVVNVLGVGVNEALTEIGNAAVSLGLGTRVDDDGGPIVVMTMPSGTASVVVGAAWRTDP